MFWNYKGINIWVDVYVYVCVYGWGKEKWIDFGNYLYLDIYDYFFKDLVNLFIIGKYLVICRFF